MKLQRFESPRRLMTLVVVAILLASFGCADAAKNSTRDESRSGPAGKSDMIGQQRGSASQDGQTDPSDNGSDRPGVVGDLTLQMGDSNEEGYQDIELTGQVADDYPGTVTESAELEIGISQTGGASTGAEVARGTLGYNDGAGAFVTDSIEVPLPWQQLTIELTGQIQAVQVDKTYTFSVRRQTGGRIDGQLEQNNNQRVVEALTKLKINNYQSEAGDRESFELIGKVDSRVAEQIQNGHTLDVEVYASDGASNTDYRLESELEYHLDGLGAYSSERIDTSSLLPWRRLTVEVTGSIREFSVDQTFHFRLGDREAKPVDE